MCPALCKRYILSLIVQFILVLFFIGRIFIH